jgi:hypothetical protein
LGRKKDPIVSLFKFGVDIIKACNHVANDIEKSNRAKERAIELEKAQLAKDYNAEIKRRNKALADEEKARIKVEKEQARLDKILEKQKKLELKMQQKEMQDKVKNEQKEFRDKEKQKQSMEKELIKRKRQEEKDEAVRINTLKQRLSKESIDEFFNKRQIKSGMTVLNFDISLQHLIDNCDQQFKDAIESKIKSQKLDLDYFLFSGKFNSVLGLSGINSFKRELSENGSQLSTCSDYDFFKLIFNSGVYFQDDFVTSDDMSRLNKWRKHLLSKNSNELVLNDWNFVFNQSMKIKENYFDYVNFFYNLKLVS